MAGTTNFIQFNPNQNNQETDSNYEADSTRASGGVDGNPFQLFSRISRSTSGRPLSRPSRICWQTRTSRPAMLHCRCSRPLWQRSSRRPIRKRCFSSLPMPRRCPSTRLRRMDSRSRSLATWQALPSVVPLPGQVLSFILVQDSTGNRTFTWPAGSSAPQPDPTANAVSVLALIVRSDGSLHPYTPMTVS